MEVCCQVSVGGNSDGARVGGVAVVPVGKVVAMVWDGEECDCGTESCRAGTGDVSLCGVSCVGSNDERVGDE